MKQATRDRLHALNARFYETNAEHFSRTRERPWHGCERVLQHVTASCPSLLDVGCGNGRLIALLHSRYAHAFSYTGVDASANLLAFARARFGTGAGSPRFVRADFVASAPDCALPAGAFDCVVLLGVMHHVPGEHARRALVAAAAERLAPDGILALTLWRFDQSERFARRRVLPDDESAISFEGGDMHADLDPGDHLLYWGDRRDAMRYCHAADDAELERWIDGLDLVIVDRFRADGSGEQLNDYVVLRRAQGATGEHAASKL